MSTLKANRYENTASANGGIDIDSSGRVLLGTSTARSAGDVTASLQVEGTDFATSSLNLISNAGAAAGNVSHISLAKSRGTSDGSSTAFADGDNLGVLQWCGADGTDLNSTAASINAKVDGTPGSNDMPGRLIFSTTPDGGTSPTERMQIKSDGTVEIKKSSTPTLRLNQNDQFFAPIKLAGNDLEIRGSSGQIEFYTGNADGDSSTQRMMVSDAGDLRIGTAANAGNGKIEVSFDASRNGIHLRPTTSTLNQNFLIFTNSAGSTTGKIEQNGTTSTNYVTSSDYRLKENIVDLDGAITRVKQLAPKRFNFIGEADRTVDGFLAHEAQTVVPEAISGTHNGVEVWKEGQELPEGVSVGDNKLDEDGNTIPDYQGIDQSRLVPLLTAALQEAIGKIETLEAKVAALEAA